jgi:S1-C subfamily serine protease
MCVRSLFKCEAVFQFPVNIDTERMIRNVVILSVHMKSVVVITSQLLIPIFILVAIVGLSFAYVGSIAGPSSSSSSANQGQPWLGISAVEISPELSNEIGLAESTGLLVLQVAPGGPAERAGVKGGNSLKVIGGSEIPIGGDVIIRVDGNAIRNLDDFRSLLNGKEVGDKLQFTLVGPSNEIRNADVRLEVRPA